MTIVKGEVKVISPRDGSPAAAAGLKPGDLLLAIDKEPTYEMTLPEVEQKLRGTAGSTVKLTLQRGGEGAPLRLTLNRAAEHAQTVTARVDRRRYRLCAAGRFRRRHARRRWSRRCRICGSRPAANCSASSSICATIRAAISGRDRRRQRLSRQGRSRGGQGPRSRRLKHIAATPNDLAKGLPIVALVNGGTADEAELMAAALQDNHRALLIGTKTFGESAIETLIPLASGGAIRLTTAHFESPDGKEIDGKGLDPDLVVTPLKLEKMANEEGLHEADLPGALKNPDQPAPATSNAANPSPPPGKTGPAATSSAAGAASAAAKPAGSVANKTAPSVANEDLGGANDEQLTQALDVLRGLAVFNPHASG